MCFCLHNMFRLENTVKMLITSLAFFSRVIEHLLLTHYHTMPNFDYYYNNNIAVENIVRKGESACKKQFLLFSQSFLLYIAQIYFSFYMHFKMLSAICFNLDRCKILSSGNGLNIDSTSFS